MNMGLKNFANKYSLVGAWNTSCLSHSFTKANITIGVVASKTRKNASVKGQNQCHKKLDKMSKMRYNCDRKYPFNNLTNPKEGVMKNLFKVIALLIVAILATGCATTGAGHDTITGTVAGGLIGGAVAGNKGARIGALLGAGIGVLSDSASRKDNERAEKIDSLIYSKTGSGNDSGATQAAATAESNLAFAEQQRRKCEAKYAVYQK